MIEPSLPRMSFCLHNFKLPGRKAPFCDILRDICDRGLDLWKEESKEGMNSSKNPFGVIPLTEQPLNHQVTTHKTKAASDVEEKPQDSTKAQADCRPHHVQKPDTPPRACACCCHIAK